MYSTIFEKALQGKYFQELAKNALKTFLE